MKIKIPLLIITLMTLVACGYQKQDAEIMTPEQKLDAAMEVESTPDEVAQVTFDLTGENFKFMMNGVEAPDLKVKKGDRVTVNLTSTNGFHDWVVDAFGAATERVDTGNSTSVAFIANETGTFEYYCSVGQHRANGMKGNLIVE